MGRVILPAVFTGVLALTLLNIFSGQRALLWIGLGLLPTLGLISGAYAIPVLVGRIIVDRHGLVCNVDGMRLNLSWREVRAARIVVQDREPYLMIGVGSGLYVLPVHLFDVKALWEAVREAAPAKAVRADALDHYTRKDANEGIPPDMWVVGALRVADHRGLVIVSGLSGAGFLLIFIIMLLLGQPGGPVFLVFSILYLLVLTGVGATDFDQQGVTRRTMLGVTRILWDDLAAVEMGPFGLRISLEGMSGQRLVMFGPPMWTGPDAARAVHFLALQISTRRLPRRQSITVLFKLSKKK